MVKYINHIIYWSIVVIPFSIAIAPALTYTLMGFLFIGFILKKIILKERLFVNTSVNLPFLLLALISLISFRNTIDYHSSIRGMTKLLQNVLMVLICIEEIKDRRHIIRIILFIILGASLSSFDGIWQVIFGKDFIRCNEPILNIGLKRATAAFPNANVFGSYLSAITPLIVGLTFYYYEGKAKLIMLGVSLLALCGVVLSFSRGTGLAIYASLLFLSIFIRLRAENHPAIGAGLDECRKVHYGEMSPQHVGGGPRRPSVLPRDRREAAAGFLGTTAVKPWGSIKRNKIIPILLIVILLVSSIFMPKGIKDWAKDVNYNPAFILFNADRISIYKNTFNMIRHHPIIGVGVNTFSQNYLKYKLPEPNDARSGEHMYAHNNFLQMAGEIGLSGLIVFLWLLFRFFKKNFAIYRSTNNDFYKVLSVSISACILAYLINGITETTLYYSRIAMIFWFLMGFALALEKLANDPQPQRS